MTETYDSDSSDGDFTETNVLLGFATSGADEETVSKLGGRPDWLEQGDAPSATLARCRACNELMVLLLQLNGELPDRFPAHERRLYVFACKGPACRRKEGSVRALRGVNVWEDAEIGTAESRPSDAGADRQQPPPEEKSSALGEALFGVTTSGGGGVSGGGNMFSDKANPFSTASGAIPSSPDNPFSSRPKQALSSDPTAPSLAEKLAQSLSLENGPSHPPPQAPSRPEPWPAVDLQPAPFRTLYLTEAEYETLDSTPAKIPANARMEEADASEPSVLDREAFESTMDAVFQKFADRISQNPDQVIRYEFAGSPLLYSKTDLVGSRLSRGGMPSCANCGAARTFEVQLMPNAIAELEAGEPSLEGMEWGTIIIGVCTRDCLPRGCEGRRPAYLEEWVGVQWEELTPKPK